MSPTFEAMVHPVDVIAGIRARLEARGGTRELEHLASFSSAELARLVELEVGIS